MSLFDLRGLCVRYNGREVLRDITLRVEPGERIALVGKSGAGKSTLLNVLYQQQRAESTLIPQDLGLVKSLSVFHNIYMGRLNRHATWYNLLNLVRPVGREVDKVSSLLSKLKLEDKIFEPVGELSGGQQQRTAIGRAIHQGNRTLVGDEPVSSVDEHQARVVLDTLNEAHETVLLAMHDVQLALYTTDRIVGLQDGRIVMDQPTSSLDSNDLKPLYQN